MCLQILYLKFYKHNPKNVLIFFIITQTNVGTSIVRNKSIRCSSSIYIGFIDNDDWITSEYIEKLLNKEYATNADITECNHINYSLDLECAVGLIRHNDASIQKFGLNIMESKGYVWRNYKKRIV